MTMFAIVEIDDGLTIVELQTGELAEDAAIRAGGMLVDPGPYETYEDACDAMAELEAEDDMA
jgi:hypothetical protein